MHISVKLIVLNLVVLPLYLLLDFVFQSHFLFSGVTGQLILLLPMLVLRKSGFLSGAVSAFIFSVWFIIYTMAAHILSPTLAMFLFMNLAVNSVSTGIASYRLEDKRASILFIPLAIIIQIVIRIAL